MVFEVRVFRSSIGRAYYDALVKDLSERNIEFEDKFTYSASDKYVTFRANKKLLKSLNLWDQTYNPEFRI